VERLPVVLALSPVAERAVERFLFGRTALVEPRASAPDADELEREAVLAEVETVLISPRTVLASARGASALRGLPEIYLSGSNYLR
jgi:hypothetical protein